MSLYQTTYDSSTKEWKGRPQAPTYHPNVNAGKVLLDAMNRNPSGIGQINDNNGLKLSNGELRFNAIRVAQHLHRLGIRSGDIVAVLAANHHHVSSVVFGAIALAAPVNILGLNFDTGEFQRNQNDLQNVIDLFIEEIIHMLKITQPKMVFCESSNVDRVREALEQLALDLPVYLFDDNSNGLSVEDLVAETGNEEDFMYVYDMLTIIINPLQKPR